MRRSGNLPCDSGGCHSKWQLCRDDSSLPPTCTFGAPMPRLLPSLRLFVCVVVCTSFAALPLAAKSPDYARDVLPVLKRMCFDCHGAKKQSGDLRLDNLKPEFLRGAAAETWHDVLNKLNLGEMPPKKAKQLDAGQRKILVDWLTGELKRASQVRRSTGGRVVMRRLTRYEYNNTLRDLLGLDLEFASDLPPEAPSRDGFRNNGAVLGISPLQVEFYLKTARTALNKAIVTGARPELIRHLATKSEKVRRVKGSVSNKLGPNDRFLVRMDKFPREGEVLVRVKASAIVPPSAGYPRMRVTMGVRADVFAPEKAMGEVDVVAGPVQTFEFRGRAEEFPLPGHNPKYPGLQVSVYNDYGDGKPTKKRKKKKGKKQQPIPADQPVIVIESVEFVGPIYQTWPPASHARIFIKSDSQDSEQQYAREIIRRFMFRAYRRPVTSQDVDPMIKLFGVIRPKAASFEAAVRDVLSMVLVSPEFLYMVERRAADSKRQPLSNFELASRLSYFLWSTMPDERLLKLARQNLSDPSQLAGEVERMIADPRSWQFVSHFTDQWLDLPGLDRVAVNPEFYPQFDDRLKSDMRGETQHFFNEVLQKNLSSLSFIDAKFTMLNRRLAKHYGLQGPKGSEFQRVELTDRRRGGLLTHASFHLINSNGEDSHAIKRAVWLLDRLLDDPPAPPPPDVPDLDREKKELAGLSLKRQLELHRTKQALQRLPPSDRSLGRGFRKLRCARPMADICQGSPKRSKTQDHKGRCSCYIA